MTIWIENNTSNPIFENYESVLKSVINECIKQEGYPDNVEVSLSIVDNNEIKSLNKQFRNIDRATDVLSFPILEAGLNSKKADSLNLDTDEILLGDIIISIEKAIEQAKEFNHSLERELSFLTSHSMFHLFGYDHENTKAEEIMNQKQESVLSKLQIYR